MNSEISWLVNADRMSFEALNKTFTSNLFDMIMPVLSNFLVWVIPLGIAWVVFFFITDRRGKIVAMCCFLVVAATDQVASHVIKPMVQRERPCNVVPQSHLYQDGSWQTTDKFALTKYTDSYSFPSTHATNMAGQAMYWGYFYPEVSPILAAAAVLVGFSRVYLGMHWPMDILAGYLLGVILALIVAYPLRVWLPRNDY